MKDCDSCALCESASKVCQFGEGNKTSKIMVIADNPTAIENRKGLLFADKPSIQFKKALLKRGIDPDEDVYWTCAVKCPTPEDGEPTAAQLKSCKHNLEAEIEVVQPAVIVPMGNIAMKAVLNKTGITKRRGKAQEHNGAIILPTHHPRSILRRPGYKNEILKDLDSLKDIVDNKGIAESSGVEYESVETVQEALDAIEYLRNGTEDKDEWLVFDLETTGLNAWWEHAKIVCVSLTFEERKGFAIPLYHKDSPFTTAEAGTIVKALRQLLQNKNIRKVAQNGKFDIRWLDVWLDIKVENFAFDTLIAHYIAVSEEMGSQSLGKLAWEYTDMGGYDNELEEYKQTLPEADRHNYDNIPWAILSKYAVGDVDCTLRLLKVFKPLIDANPKWVRLMNEILLPCAGRTLVSMEKSGMYVDKERAEWLSKEYENELGRLSEKLKSYPEVLEIEREKRDQYARRQGLLGSKKPAERTDAEKEFIKKSQKYKNFEFNWNSVNHLRELLFDRLNLDTPVTTKKGEKSTNAESLEIMSEQHELPNLMLEYRKISTLNNMFIKKVPGLVDNDSIIHPSFNLTGTVTGRMSSENPNAQQFPRKIGDPMSFQYNHEVKSMFKSRFEEGAILQYDYSQLELRIAGIISGDDEMLRVYKSGEDLHTATASAVWKVPVSEVSKDLRSNAKAVNFGIVYGKSGITFAKDLYSHLPWNEAKGKGFKLVDDYLNTFPKLAAWMEGAKRFAKKYGYAETMFGRHRRLPDLRSRDDFLRSESERQAVNAPIQGTGSDMTLLSMVQIQDWLDATNKKTVMIVSVHDSIVFDVYLPELPEVFDKIKEIMESVHLDFFDSEVPILSEAELGSSYGDMIEVDDHMGIDSLEKFNTWIKSEKDKKREKDLKTLEEQGYTPNQIEQYKRKYQSS